MFMCFWIVFTGEHLLDQSERNKLQVYWRQVGCIGFGCLCLLVFDMCERGYQLHNPFYSIWATEPGSALDTGIYGMWNTYVLTLMYLYEPCTEPEMIPELETITEPEIIHEPETIPGPETIPESHSTDRGTRNDPQESPK
ncbi:protein wntless isoform X1 [Nematostella vectensis]|uniref:protein wntless isoform X1 n=1 Tax=Nematostella vectensis TaxID=45351 RepID=UPI00207799FC|nr:protein wntless isoform X1 [Nematostella vectensis]